jgi:hypothetical protein
MMLDDLVPKCYRLSGAAGTETDSRGGSKKLP